MTHALPAPRSSDLRILSQPLPESIFRLGVKCVDVGTVNDTAYAKFGDGSEVEADVVLGADGIHSVVREKLFGEDAPRFTYNLCWRMVVPFDEQDRSEEQTSELQPLMRHPYAVFCLKKK